VLPKDHTHEHGYFNNHCAGNEFNQRPRNYLNVLWTLADHLPRLDFMQPIGRLFKTGLSAALLAGAVLTFPTHVHASILWSRPDPEMIRDTGDGVDILHGAIKHQDSNSTSTLYFRFHVDPIADSATKSIGDYDAGLVLFENGQAHLGLGSSKVAWAYCAMNVIKSEKGFMDLNSATPEPGFHWEYMRAGMPKYIAFKVQFIPGHEARVTAWLNPVLDTGATEINQPTNCVTQFEANATFDEIHLMQTSKIGGWKFSQIVAATTFEDLRLTHFWQSGWFLSLAGGGLLVLVISGVQLLERRRARGQIQRLERENAVAAERGRIARDIHDELGASLTKIHKLAEMMDHNDRQPDNANALPKIISNAAHDTIRSLDEIVWAINPKNDTLSEMADYLVYYTEDFLRSTNITCALDVQLNLPDIQVDAEVRHNLFMSVKEGLNNAVKHANASQIKFALNFQANTLTIELTDNGRGFCSNTSGPPGNGLDNISNRMSAINGEVSVQSEPDRGTTLKLKVLLKKDKVVAP